VTVARSVQFVRGLRARSFSPFYLKLKTPEDVDGITEEPLSAVWILSVHETICAVVVDTRQVCVLLRTERQTSQTSQTSGWSAAVSAKTLYHGQYRTQSGAVVHCAFV
jgi:hypothetical protein